MKQLANLEEYKAVLKACKPKYRGGFNNLYLGVDAINRYLSMGRMYYEENDAGIIFFLDEGSFYKVSMCVNQQIPFLIAPMKKKLLVRNIYKQKPEDWEAIENTLKKNGFDKTASVLQIQANVNELFEKNKKVEKFFAFMNKGGYRCITAEADMLDEIQNLIIRSRIIKDYHIDYRTPEETKEDLEKESYLCIVDRQGKVCAGSYALIKNGIAEGVAIAIDEQYKMSGFAPILSYERCKRLKEKGITNIQGWVLADNDASIKYHKSIGYQFTGRYADEWILNKATKP